MWQVGVNPTFHILFPGIAIPFCDLVEEARRVARCNSGAQSGLLLVTGQEAVLGGERSGLASSAQAQLVQYPADVVSGGVAADDKPRGDLLIRHAVCYQRQAFSFPV